MMPWSIFPMLERKCEVGHIPRYRFLLLITGILCVSPFIVDVVIMATLEVPGFRRTLYASFFSFCALISIWTRLSAITPRI
ncbi:hypothetical protein DFH94DRAFT_287761 [Russula ochroleuca]|uniref:Uncharacterized protein n=1 Tax=Russula ochroleuca TaxID=152965 RepID=A0A9P5JWR7_9AGAM|nr:hypothetical protein DFH94DRAFT_287761 [Russula ochroleuca]